MIHYQSGNSKSNYNNNAYVYFNEGYQPHFHSNYEFIYLLDGKIDVTVNGKTESMEKGDLALILSNQVHSIKTVGSSNMWIGVFSRQFIPHFDSKIKDLVGNKFVFRLDDVTEAFIREKLVFSESSTMQKKACLYAICDGYLSSVTLDKRNVKSEEVICRMLEYVEKNFREDITLSDLADHFGYEYHYLSRLLNNGSCISFPDTLNRFRVEYAVTLLENTDKSITDIAIESGFRSIRSFNHIFKSVMGLTPSEIKKG